MTPPKTTLDQALELAAEGFFVFTCKPNSKKPAFEDNLNRATRDPAAIRAMWTVLDARTGVTRIRDYNIGIYTGRFGDGDESLLVVDKDVKKNSHGVAAKGEESLAKLDALAEINGTPEWLKTRRVETPSGGAHYYFLSPTPVATSRSKIEPGIDISGVGGYVVGPGSTIDGKPYVDLGGDLRQAPAWLVELAGAPRRRERDARENLASEDHPANIKRAIVFLRDVAEPALEGSGGDHQTFKVACEVRDYGISEPLCLELMFEHYNPRCEPEWPFDQLAIKISNAYAYANGAAGSESPEADFEPVTDEEPADIPKQGGAAQGASSPLDTICAASLAGRSIPPREWHVPGLIPGRNVTLAGGDGATGKSLLMMMLAASTALSLPWLGLEVIAGRALYIGAEDETDEMERRIVAIAEAYGVGLEQLTNLHFRSLVEDAETLLATFDGSNTMAVTTLWRRLEALVAELRPRLLVLDTLADLFGGEENRRVQARQFITLLRRLAVKFNLAIILLAHPSLSGINSGSGSSGSTAWSNSVRSRLYLAREIVDGAEPDEDIRVLTTKKANYGRTGSEIRMRWCNGVFVPEARFAAPGSTAGPRSSADANAEVDRLFLELLDAYRAEGRHVSESLSKTYAPTVFANDPRGRGIQMRAFRDAMNRLFAAGIIRNAADGPPSRRRNRIVRVDK